MIEWQTFRNQVIYGDFLQFLSSVSARCDTRALELDAVNALRGLALLLLLQIAGEGLTRVLSLPFPGPVVGLVLLLIALHWAWIREPVAAIAEMLLAHLSLLFVPVGVGVITHLQLVSQFGWKLLLVIVLSTWIGLAVTALALRRLLRSDSADSEHP